MRNAPPTEGQIGRAIRAAQKAGYRLHGCEIGEGGQTTLLFNPELVQVSEAPALAQPSAPDDLQPGKW